MLRRLEAAKTNLTLLLGEETTDDKAILRILNDLRDDCDLIDENMILRSQVASVLCEIRKQYSNDKNSPVFKAVKDLIAIFKNICTSSDDYSALPSKKRKIVDAFIHVLTIGDADLALAQRLACRIEAALSREIDDEKSYKDQVRSLIHNLKYNEQLRLSILDGTIDPSQLATFSKDELATDEQREARAETVKSSLKDRLVEAHFREVAEKLSASNVDKEFDPRERE